MRLLILFLLVTAVLAGMRAVWTGHAGDPWAQVARRIRPLLADIERDLRANGRTEEADRIAACSRTVRGWEARP